LISPAYEGRPQTYVKHVALRRYLQRFALIVGSRWETLIYVDCFSGPWMCAAEDFSDSSFAIAIEQLTMARDYHKERSRTISLRCFFVEKDPANYRQLEGFIRTRSGVQIEARNSAFEDAIPAIGKFVANAGRSAFPFYFIDPTGWTGFSMRVISPLLSVEPSEVLVNFMTGHISRFLEMKESQESFVELFGADVRAEFQGLNGQDREDAAVFIYARNLARACGYKHTCVAVVIKNDENRAHFHLIYATRSPKGVEVFKEAERKAMEAMEQARVERIERDLGMGSLFGEEELGPSKHYGTLRARYLGAAEKTVRELLMKSDAGIPFHELCMAAAFFPLVWEGDVKSWVDSWEKKGLLENRSRRPRQRVPRPDDLLTWKGDRP
jgi:three-Cys-motif partner protein